MRWTVRLRCNKTGRNRRAVSYTHLDVYKRQVVLTAPVKAGTIVLHNGCGLDSDVMVTKNVDAG